MFTIKLKHGPFGDTTVCGMRYDISPTNATDSVNCPIGATLTVYQKTHSGEAGTEFQIGTGHVTAYTVCFVENAAGKTIDRIGPFGDPPTASLGEDKKC